MGAGRSLPSTKDTIAQQTSQKKGTDGVLADLLQRGLRLRDAMANSASAVNNLSDSTMEAGKSISPALVTSSSPNNQYTFGDHGDDMPHIDDSIDAVRKILAAQGNRLSLFDNVS